MKPLHILDADPDDRIIEFQLYHDWESDSLFYFVEGHLPKALFALRTRRLLNKLPSLRHIHHYYLSNHQFLERPRPGARPVTVYSQLWL